MVQKSHSQPHGMKYNLVNNGEIYQPQLVSEALRPRPNPAPQAPQEARQLLGLVDFFFVTSNLKDL